MEIRKNRDPCVVYYILDQTSHCRASMAGKSCSERRLSKEMASLMKESPPGCTAELKGKNLSEWTATIQGPPGSPYQDGTFVLDIIFPRDYPFKPPTVTFRTRIYHCNINSKGRICLDILKEQWSPALTMDKVLLSVRLLLAAPNPQSPLVGAIAKLLVQNKEEHDRTAREWTTRYALTTL